MKDTFQTIIHFLEFLAYIYIYTCVHVCVYICIFIFLKIVTHINTDKLSTCIIVLPFLILIFFVFYFKL